MWLLEGNPGEVENVIIEIIEKLDKDIAAPGVKFLTTSAIEGEAADITRTAEG